MTSPPPLDDAVLCVFCAARRGPRSTLAAARGQSAMPDERSEKWQTWARLGLHPASPSRVVTLRAASIPIETCCPTRLGGRRTTPAPIHSSTLAHTARARATAAAAAPCIIRLARLGFNDQACVLKWAVSRTEPGLFFETPQREPRPQPVPERQQHAGELL